MSEKRYTMNELKKKFFPRLYAKEEAQWVCNQMFCHQLNEGKEIFCRKCGRYRYVNV